MRGDNITGVIKKNLLTNIRDQKMDRKDFLKYSGVVLISVVGFKGLISVLSQTDSKTVIVKESSPRGFGSGKYGG